MKRSPEAAWIIRYARAWDAALKEEARRTAPVDPIQKEETDADRAAWAARARLAGAAMREQRLEEEDERARLRKIELQIINAGFRSCSVKAHPDAGGSNDAMVELNEAKSNLIRASR